LAPPSALVCSNWLCDAGGAACQLDQLAGHGAIVLFQGKGGEDQEVAHHQQAQVHVEQVVEGGV
jgi:hypothetical protein